MQKPLNVQGFLLVKYSNLPWKRKWCELRGENFNFLSATTKKRTGTIHMNELSGISEIKNIIMPDRNIAYAFEFTFNNKDNKLQLCTTSADTSKQWIDRLQETLKYYRNRYRIRQKMEHSLSWSKTCGNAPNLVTPPGCYGHTLTPPIVCAPKDDSSSTSKTRKRACSMWMFGGKRSKTELCGDLWELHFPNFVEPSAYWIKVESDSSTPSARFGHTSIVYGKYMLLFGGKTSSGPCNELHMFHTDNRQWSSPRCDGPKPAARYHHSSSVIGNEMYVFGGKSGNTIFDDIYVLNLDFMSWRKVQPAPSSLSPKAVCGHSATCVGANLMFVFGGYHPTGQLFNTLWVYDCSDATWSTPTVRGTPPPPRRGHIATLVGKNLFISGGKPADGTIPLDDIYYLCTDSFIWYHSNAGGDDPKARWGHCASELNNTQYIFGGTDHSQLMEPDVFALATKPLESQWFDLISNNASQPLCWKCNERAGSGCTSLFSSFAVFHEKCLRAELNNGIEDILKIPLQLQASTDFFYLLSFVNRLLEDKTHPLSLNINKFGNEFNSEYGVFDKTRINKIFAQGVEEVNVYLESFLNLISSNIKLLDFPEAKESCMILLKRQLFPKIYDVLFKLFTEKNVVQDAFFASRVAQLQHFTLRDLQLNEKFVLPNSTEEHPYQKAIDLFSLLGQLKDPFLKIDCLMLVQHLIHYIIDDYFTAHESATAPSERCVAADDIVVLFQAIILRARVSCLRSELTFIRCFLGESFTSGEIDYCLISLEVAMDAINFIPTD